MEERLSLRPDYTFARFVRGPGNRLACAAAQAVAENPGRAYNPLFIYGGVGLGKTHLLQAIGNYVLENAPELRALYTTSERFAIELVESIQSNRTAHFRRRYREVDLLLLDDVQFLKNKEGTQEELFHTFNELYNLNRQIVLSSDRPPEELRELQERLVSRFRWGLVAEIEPPDFATRLAILEAKARANGLPIESRILELIASRISSNVRSLEGALIRAVAYAALNGVELTPDLVGRLLPLEQRAGALDIGVIKAEIASQYLVSVADLESENRDKRVAQARQIAIYLARELTRSSFPEIGKEFGGRDHSTVIRAYRRVKELEGIPLFQSELEELKSSLRTKFGAKVAIQS
ncbi:MAG: chromosomal replication initiator protein DnaA [Candidatus Acetothermia bacterium]|nr:chromosomal replication initiator protein DnaA [Candidatus Acetothermia bacterium]MDH7505644.1 chromosomal replication initiator protein DnaA [Candidatus Acetothermia bacterium]